VPAVAVTPLFTPVACCPTGSAYDGPAFFTEAETGTGVAFFGALSRFFAGSEPIDPHKDDHQRSGRTVRRSEARFARYMPMANLPMVNNSEVNSAPMKTSCN
jgi:hypothetical protein